MANITTFTLSAPSISYQQTTDIETKTPLKFIAFFERINNTYDGEFGFDWMRDDYKTICQNYDALKKEYDPIKIHKQEYFTPWLSMFPNQERVKLKLKIKTIEGSIDDDDIVKIPSEKGVRFEPNEVKISEIKENGIEITVFCDKPLNQDTTISLLDKNNKKVGRLKVFKNANHTRLHFNITPVRILRSVSKETDIELIEKRIDIKGTKTNKDGTKIQIKGWGDKNADLPTDLKKLEHYLNTQSLNQALLQCTIGKVYDIIIDEDKWIADGLIIDEGCVFKDNEVLDKFYQLFEEQYPIQAKKRGIIVFLSPLSQEQAGGEGNIRNIEAKQCVVYYDNLWNKETFAHEISHVLGLTHSFQEKNSKEDIFIMNRFIKQVDDYINYMIDNNKSKHEIAEEWDKYKEQYKEYRSYLNIYYRNPYIFEKAKTENIMDYDNIRKSFWKYQWKAMQDDMIKFYNTK